MVQQNMFPQEVRNGKQSQRTGAKAQRDQQPAVVIPMSSTPQARTIQLGQPSQLDPKDRQLGSRNYGNDSGLQTKSSVHLFGRVGRYFEVKQTSTGKSVATFSLATERSFKDESGRWQKQTVWQRIVAWGETARFVGELIQKGARVSVEGKFKTPEWTDRENNLRTTTELVARTVRFLDLAEA